MIDRWRALPPYPRRVLTRLACAPLLWVILLSIVFVLLEVVFDPTEGLIGTPTDIERIRGELGLDRPVLERYRDFWQRLLTFDHGRALVNDRPITESLRIRYKVSLELLVLTMAFAVTIAVSLGLIAQLQSTSVRIGASALSALPLFAVIIFALIWPLEWWNYVPRIGQASSLMNDPVGNLKQFIPPSFIAGLIIGAWSSRLVAQTLRFEAAVSLRSVAIACGRAAADCLPLAVSSLIILEMTYTLPGLGDFLFRAAFSRDTQAMEAVLIFAFAIGLLVWAVRPLAPPAALVPMNVEVRWHWNARPVLVVAVVLLVALTVVAIVGPWLGEHNAYDLSGMRDENPSWNHPLGTDKLGRDVLARTLLGMRTSLKIAALATALGAVPGWALGFILRRFERPFLFLDDLAAAWLAIPLLPWFFVWLWALSSGGWRSVVTPLAIHCFMIGVRLARNSSAHMAWRDRAHDTMTWLTLLAACASAAALAVANEAAVAYIGPSFIRESLGQEIYRARGVQPMHEWAILAPTLVLSTITFAFLLIRSSLDRDVPARPYER